MVKNLKARPPNVPKGGANETQGRRSEVTEHFVPLDAVGVAVAQRPVDFDKGGAVAHLPLRTGPGIEALVRGIVRDELRAVLREELPALLSQALPSPVVGARSDYLSTEDAASLAGVRPETIRIWVSKKRLPGHWAGSRLRIRRDELEAFLATGGQGDHAVDLETRARELLDGRFDRKRGR